MTDNESMDNSSATENIKKFNDSVNYAHNPVENENLKKNDDSNQWTIKKDGECKYIDEIKNKIDEFNSKELYKLKKIENYYQEKWFDWFTISNYHICNNYNKFYKPCKEFNYVPTKDNIKKCIEGKNYNYGVYEDTFSYTPISIIFLLGCSKEELIEIYLYELIKTIKNKEFDDNYELIKRFKNIGLQESIKKVEIENSKNILKNILNTDKIYEDVLNEIIKSINNIIDFSDKQNEFDLKEIILYQKLVPYYKNKNIIKKPDFIFVNNKETTNEDFDKYLYKDESKKKMVFNYLKYAKDKIANIFNDDIEDDEIIKKYKKNLCWYEHFNKDNKSKIDILFDILKKACYICFTNIPIVDNIEDLYNKEIKKTVGEDLKISINDMIKKYKNNIDIDIDIDKVNDIKSSDKIGKKNSKDICNPSNIDPNLFDNMFGKSILKYLIYFIAIVIIIFYILFIYIIVIAAWGSFANVFNYIFFGIYYIINTIYILFYRIFINKEYKDTKQDIINIHKKSLEFEILWNRLLLFSTVFIKNKKAPIVILVLFSLLIIIITIIYILYDNISIFLK
jgi:hypothetical protein